VPGPLDEAAVLRLAEAFRVRYESVVGAGSAPRDTPVEVVAVSVSAQLGTRIEDPPARPASRCGPVRHKRAVFDGNEAVCPVYDWESLGAGQVVAGPAFVETLTTTAVVYPGQQVTVAKSGDLLLTFAAAGT
jgi:N-methylhydantoinase A